LTAKITDPNDADKFTMVYAPDCYFLTGSIAWSDASKFIDGPISGGISDASKLVIVPSDVVN